MHGLPGAHCTVSGDLTQSAVGRALGASSLLQVHFWQAASEMLSLVKSIQSTFPVWGWLAVEQMVLEKIKGRDILTAEKCTFNERWMLFASQRKPTFADAEPPSWDLLGRGESGLTLLDLNAHLTLPRIRNIVPTSVSLLPIL